MRTPTENDYFLLEYRNPQHCKWDKYISSSSTLQGMLAYHVDYTKNYQKLWYDKAAPNVDETHECMKLVRSVPMTSNSPSQTFFPGAIHHDERKYYRLCGPARRRRVCHLGVHIRHGYQL